MCVCACARVYVYVCLGVSVCVCLRYQKNGCHWYCADPTGMGKSLTELNISDCTALPMSAFTASAEELIHVTKIDKDFTPLLWVCFVLL